MMKVLVVVLIPVLFSKTNGKKDEGAGAVVDDDILIFPGTKWCGAGNTAEHYDDLGSSRKTDLCCRAHDYCSDFISPGETKYNLTNNGLYARLTCACDETFRNCLKAANTEISNGLGSVYFNLLNQYCFREDQICLKYKYWFDFSQFTLRMECVSSQFKYGWFPLKIY